MRAHVINHICVFILLLLQFIFVPFLFSHTGVERNIAALNSLKNDSLTFTISDEPFSINSNQIKNIPVRETRDILKFLPGVTEFQGKLYLNGSRYDESDFSVDGFSIYDFVSGQQFIPIPKFALEEIRTSTFGLNTKHGNNGSNEINYELKSSKDLLKLDFEHITDNLGFNSRDHFYLGQSRLGSKWYGYNESNFNISGPIIENKLTFFTNLNYKFMRDRNPQLYPGVDNLEVSDVELGESSIINIPNGIVFGNSQQSFNLIGKMNYLADNFRIDITGIFDNDLKDAPRNHILDYFNKRLGKFETNTGFFSIAANHEISDKFSYDLSGSYSFKSIEIYDEYLKDNYWSYGDSLANAEAGVNWERTEDEKERWKDFTFTRYLTPSSHFYNGHSFRAMNDLPVNYSKKYQRKISFGGEINYKCSHKNKFTLGFSSAQLLLRNWETLSYQSNLARSLYNYQKYYVDDSLEKAKQKVIYYDGVNNYGYDILGNKSDEGFDAPPKPSFTNIYIKNKFNYENFIFDWELRYDSFYLDNNLFLDPIKPELSYIFSRDGNTIPSEKGFKKSPTRGYISPRIHISYLLSKKSKLNLSLGKYISQPELSKTYSHPLYFYYLQNLDGFTNPNELTFNNDIKPVITQKAEIAYYYKSENIFFNINGYYKEIENQIMPKIVVGNYFYDFLSYSNQANSTIKGFLIQTGITDIKGFSILSNTSYQNTTGTKYYYDYNSWVTLFIRKKAVPLSYQKSFSTALVVDYSFESAFPNNSLFKDLFISVLLKYSSGNPYNLTQNIYSRLFTQKPLYNEMNNLVSPSNSQLNLKLEKSFELSKSVSANLYIYVINLFNNINILDLFYVSGSATDDGVNIHPNEIEAFGENYETLYELINVKYNPKNAQQNLFDEPRQVIMGIKLNI